MRIAITGASGLLGRNILLEILKHYWPRLDDLEIVLLGRGTPDSSYRQRMEEILKEEALDYLGIAQHQMSDVLSWAKERLVCVDYELRRDLLDITAGRLACLARQPIDHFFHCAASTNLQNSAEVQRELTNTNVNGTQRILNLVSSLSVRKFIYVGSAYECGAAHGDIAPDCINLDGHFRNPYEKTKLLAELCVREFAKKSGVRCSYFRPSILCGRLIENPLGRTHSFDVFYAWAALLLHLKMGTKRSWINKYAEPCELNIRFCFNHASGLNIVPVDFAAKLMWQTCLHDPTDSSFHFVNEQETPHALYIPLILEALNISGTQFVEVLRGKMNPLERVYYKIGGSIYAPYVTAPPMLFCTHNLETIQRKIGLRCPPVNETNFRKLMEYAVKRDFKAMRRGK